MGPLLHEHDSELEARLIRAGKDVELCAASQAQLLAVLGIAAGVAASGEAAASTGLLGKLLGSKAILAGVSAVSVGAIGVGAYLGSAPEAPPASVSGTVVSGPAVPGVVARPRADVDVVTENVESERVQSEKVELSPPADERPAAPAKAAIKKPSESVDGLGIELALVEAASRAVKAGNGGLALQRLSEYRRRFPRGKLGLEAQVLHIEALAISGRRSEASRLAQSFLKHHPQSPVAARIRRFAE